MRVLHPRAAALPLASAIAAAASLLAVLRLAVRATLPPWAAAFAVTGAFLLTVGAAFQVGVALGPLALDETGAARPLTRRHGFWVVAIGACVALPTLGSFGLVDPWETHYAEVAREMVERGDFVSPWWANEGWFMSKPVLLFWVEAVAMLLLGVRTGPDAVLTSGAPGGVIGEIAHPEWAIRMPGFVFATVGAYLLYWGVSRTCGRRAGFIGALVLWTMPGFALLSHQAITDMPLVAGVGASLGLLVRALALSDAARGAIWTMRIGRRELTTHVGHLATLALIAIALPQIVMLVAPHLSIDGHGLHLATDRLVSGSPHACGLPGQPACTSARVAHAALTPVIQASLWLPLLLLLAMRVVDETRLGRLLALGAWTFAAFAAMAKGPAGLVIPAAGAIAHVAATRSPRVLLRLEILAGLGVALLLIGPWYLAVWARHGRGFLDELVLRHMLGRTLDHLHDTNDGEDTGIVYFVRQLGYATFPWCGLLVAAASTQLRHDERSRRGAARALFFGAGLAAFVLVSMMRTKFHHYVLLALPGLAMTTGIWIDERLDTRRTATTLSVLAAAIVTALVGRDLYLGPGRFVLLLTYRYTRAWPSSRSFALAFGIVAALSVATILVFAMKRARAWAFVGLASVATALSLILLDVYLPRCAADGGQRGVIAAYYTDLAARASSLPARDAPLVAYQLNWKGENFYSGNHVAIFVASGAPMRGFLDAWRKRTDGGPSVYFVAERGRVAGLRNELGPVRAFTELTGPEVSSEFTLVRAEL